MPHVKKQTIIDACNRGIQRIDAKRKRIKKYLIKEHTKRLFGLLPDRTPEEAWAAVDPHDKLNVETLSGKQLQQLKNIWQAYYHDVSPSNAIVKISINNFATIAPFLPDETHSQKQDEPSHE